MEENMHQARSSKEMQYVEKSCWNGSLLYISANQECMGEKKKIEGNRREFTYSVHMYVPKEKTQQSYKITGK